MSPGHSLQPAGSPRRAKPELVVVVQESNQEHLWGSLLLFLILFYFPWCMQGRGEDPTASL